MDGDENEFVVLVGQVQHEVRKSSFSAVRMAVMMGSNDMKKKMRQLDWRLCT
jgi:hypothetical protein